MARLEGGGHCALRQRAEVTQFSVAQALGRDLAGAKLGSQVLSSGIVAASLEVSPD